MKKNKSCIPQWSGIKPKPVNNKKELPELIILNITLKEIDIPSNLKKLKVDNELIKQLQLEYGESNYINWLSLKYGNDIGSIFEKFIENIIYSPKYEGEYPREFRFAQINDTEALAIYNYIRAKWDITLDDYIVNISGVSYYFGFNYGD